MNRKLIMLSLLLKRSGWAKADFLSKITLKSEE